METSTGSSEASEAAADGLRLAGECSPCSGEGKAGVDWLGAALAVAMARKVEVPSKEPSLAAAAGGEPMESKLEGPLEPKDPMEQQLESES